MAELLRRPGYTARTQEIRPGGQAIAAAHHAQTLAKRSLQLDRAGTPSKLPQAKTHYPSPVAKSAAYRQYLRQEPDALTRTSGSVRGDRGNPVPYRDGWIVHDRFQAHLSPEINLGCIDHNIFVG